jgi:hypothetical protein
MKSIVSRIALTVACALTVSCGVDSSLDSSAEPPVSGSVSSSGSSDLVYTKVTDGFTFIYVHGYYGEDNPNAIDSYEFMFLSPVFLNVFFAKFTFLVPVASDSSTSEIAHRVHWITVSGIVYYASNTECYGIVGLYERPSRGESIAYLSMVEPIGYLIS